MAVCSLTTLRRENMASRVWFTHLQYLFDSLTWPYRTWNWSDFLSLAQVIFILQGWSLQGVHGGTLHLWRKSREPHPVPYFWICYAWIQPHLVGKGPKNPWCLPALFKNIILYYIVIYQPSKPLLGQQTSKANTLFCCTLEFFPQTYLTFFPLQEGYHKLLSFTGQIHISKSQAAFQWLKSLKIPQF